MTAAPALPGEAEAALRRFRAFYEELFAVKQLLLSGDWTALLDRRAAPAPAEEQLSRAVQLRLRRAIAAQGYSAAAAGIDPGYVMAAMADEVLLHEVAWPGAEAWADTPLEQILYRSRIAGDRIFQAIDTLHTARHPEYNIEPVGVAMTILLALQTGFRGRYWGEDDHGRIAADRQRLFSMIFAGARAPVEDPEGLLAGAAEPLAAPPPLRLPRLRPWGIAIAGVIIAYLLISWMIWHGQVSDITAAAQRIVSMAPAGG